MKENFNKFDMGSAPITIIDYETTGVTAGFHEPIDIGAVKFDQHTLEIISTFNQRIKPRHPERASKHARALNGFNEKEWENEPYIEEVMPKLLEFAKGTLFLAYNAHFDKKIHEAALVETDLADTMDYHTFCLLSGSYYMLHKLGLKKSSMKDAARFLNVPEEPAIHTGLNGAMTAYLIHKALMTKFKVIRIDGESSGAE